MRSSWGTLPAVAGPEHPYLCGPYPRAYAHRGWHLGELAGMENSLSALRRAVAEGYRYLETDVRATRDGVLVVQHDPTLQRTTDRTGTISELDWAQVRGGRIGGREPVCRLEDLLEELPRTLLNIDVKAGDAVEPMLWLLRRTGAWDRVCLASFSGARLQRLRRAAGERLLTSMGTASAAALRLRSIICHPRELPWLPAPPVRGTLAQLPRYRWRLPVVDPALIRCAHRLGREVHVWTIDRPDEMVELLELGVDGLVTDRPDLLRDVLVKRGSWPGAGP
ncbi:MAG: glycerophosphodiester phosphodiesterase [Pseudonocardiaceae bacterium]|nr:glycerophosphodiester phosphodiesterase [Pseudonocardiaceae bacterium]